MIYLVAPYKVPGITNSTIEECVEYLSTRKEIGLDLETTQLEGQKLYNYPKWGQDAHTQKVVSIQVGDSANQYIIDTRYESPALLKGILEDEAITKVGTNLKFDYTRLRKYGIWLNGIYDCMLVDLVRYCGFKKPKGFFSLAGLSSRYIGIDFDSDIPQELIPGYTFTKSTRDQFATIGNEHLTAEQVYYNAGDVILPLQIKSVQWEAIIAEKLEVACRLELKFVSVLGDLEWTGIPINVDEWIALEERVKAELEDHSKKLADFLALQASEFNGMNWNSSKQVVALFKHLEIPTEIIDKAKSMANDIVYKDSVSKANIKKYERDYPIIKDYLWYKQLRKLISSYGTKFLSHVNPITGRIHSDYWQILVTGRISSNSPNLQNLPSKIFEEGYKKCFQADPGYVLISCDYSSQESRILADVANEKSMISFFNSTKGKADIHSFVASKMFGVEVSDKVNTDLRQKGKVTNFTIAYGGGAHKIADTFQIPIDEAQKLIDFYFISFPTLKKYFREVTNKSLADGYILIDSITKRRSYHPAIDRFQQVSKTIQLAKDNGFYDQIPAEDKSFFHKTKGEIGRNAQNYPKCMG